MHQCKAGLQYDEDAGEAEHEHDDAAAIETLTEDQRREDRGPHRHGEFDRKNGREGQHRDRVYPCVLAAQVQYVAQHVQAEPACAQPA